MVIAHIKTVLRVTDSNEKQLFDYPLYEFGFAYLTPFLLSLSLYSFVYSLIAKLFYHLIDYHKQPIKSISINSV